MRLVPALRSLLLCIILCAAACALSSAAVPRPEHPFPQMVRSEWLNLNGQWEFAETNDPAEDAFLTSAPYPDKIAVPYPREAKLSGLGRTDYVTNVWYRRTFDKPDNWSAKRVLLHFGASDWKTRVWLNGTFVGEYTGGSTPFTFDVTNNVKPRNNVLVVHVLDNARSGIQPLGKQTTSTSQGCIYTRTTGIWQTVWLEGVGEAYLSDARIQPDPDNSRILLQGEINGPSRGLTLKAVAYAGGKVVGSAQAPADWRNPELVLNLSTKRLWSVQDPFLYTLKLTLLRNGKAVDSVDSYFGLRKVSIQGAAILINDKPVFQRLVLDQGFYPDGIWTAPTDAALKNDIVISKGLGFNGARLHQKVFDPRYLYWADKLGYLVWDEFPNWGVSHTQGEAVMPFINEWVVEVRRDRNHPSVIGWCPFNETGGSAALLQNTVVDLTRALDPSRPVIDTSGFTHSITNPEVLDAHDYDQNPESFRARWCDSFSPGASIPARYGGVSAYRCLPFIVSEYGGIGWAENGGWGYGTAPKDKEEFYKRYDGLTSALLDSRYMAGFCYTQIYDVEQEQNGLYTYARKPKFDPARIKAINSKVAECEKNPAYVVSKPAEEDWKILVGAFPDQGIAREWRYTFDKPADSWNTPDFDDSAWKSGFGGFGEKGGWESKTRTTWNTPDVWIRQQFNYDGSGFDRALLVAHWDNGTEVYVNGKQIWHGTGWNDRYDGYDVTDKVRDSLKPGANTIAVHCHQDAGGQFIDLALLIGGK